MKKNTRSFLRLSRRQRLRDLQYLHKFILVWYMEGVAKRRAVRNSTSTFVKTNLMREKEYFFDCWRRAIADVKHAD